MRARGCSCPLIDELVAGRPWLAGEIGLFTGVRLALVHYASSKP